MVPEWLRMLAGAGPILLIVSLVVAVFGYVRLRGHLRRVAEEKAEEEQKRLEFLRKMEGKLPKQ